MSEAVKGLSDEEDFEEEEDSETPSKKCNKSDFMKLSGNLLSNINWKVSFLLFIVGMLIFSDVFIDNVLRQFSGTVEVECTTTKGTMMQLTCIVLVYIFLDLMVKYDWL